MDQVSRFRGIAVTVSAWLYGCNRIGLQPQIKEDGKNTEPIFFDEPALTLVGTGVHPKPQTKNEDKPGGPKPDERERRPIDTRR